jgi:hypothetical protein
VQFASSAKCTPENVNTARDGCTTCLSGLLSLVAFAFEIRSS